MAFWLGMAFLAGLGAVAGHRTLPVDPTPGAEATAPPAPPVEGGLAPRSARYAVATLLDRRLRYQPIGAEEINDVLVAFGCDARVSMGMYVDAELRDALIECVVGGP